MTILVRAAVLGLATGGRNTAGLTALALTSVGSGDSWLTSRWTAVAASTATVGEMVGDKLPQTPSRLQPPGLVGRLAVGALAAGILAHRSGETRTTTSLAAAIGLAGAGAGSWLGATWRAKASAKLGRDLYGALIEDGAVLAAARWAVS